MQLKIKFMGELKLCFFHTARLRLTLAMSVLPPSESLWVYTQLDTTTVPYAYCKILSASGALAQLYLKSGGDQWRRQNLVSGWHDDRGAEHRGAEWGEVSAPQPTTGSRGASWAPPLGSGRSPGHYRIFCIWPQNASGSKKNRKNCKFHFEKVVVTVTTTFKSGGDKSPSLHTKLHLW